MADTSGIDNDADARIGNIAPNAVAASLTTKNIATETNTILIQTAGDTNTMYLARILVESRELVEKGVFYKDAGGTEHLVWCKNSEDNVNVHNMHTLDKAIYSDECDQLFSDENRLSISEDAFRLWANSYQDSDEYFKEWGAYAVNLVNRIRPHRIFASGPRCLSKQQFIFLLCFSYTR
jgi:hypothetical protein